MTRSTNNLDYEVIQNYRNEDIEFSYMFSSAISDSDRGRTLNHSKSPNLNLETIKLVILSAITNQKP